MAAHRSSSSMRPGEDRHPAINSRAYTRGKFCPHLALAILALCMVTEAYGNWPEPQVDLSLAQSRLRRQPSGGEGDGVKVNVARSKSTVWFEGYKAGCMQFLQNYIPDHKDGKPLVIGVAGGSGSGKTTIKDVIVEQLHEENVCVLPHDNYYRHRPELSDEERDLINFDHPESLETELMVHHLEKLINGEAVDIPVYDFATHLRRTDQTIRLEPRPVILVEGILILHEVALRRLMDLRVFVDVEADRRLIRRIDRDMVERGRSFASIVHQYLSTVKTMHDLFVEPSKTKADIIIPFGGRNVAAVQVLLERLKTHLRNNFAYKSAQRTSSTRGSGGSSDDRDIEGDLSGRDSSQESGPPLYTGPGNEEVKLNMVDDLERYAGSSGH